MKQGYTHISMVLDKSGSMNSILKDTIGGFNGFLQSQKETPGEATFSLTTFNTAVMLDYGFKDIASAEELTVDSYRPGGGTALYDAIGMTIVGCGKKLADMDETLRPEKVIIVILTDGEENSSREYSYEAVQKLIKEQSEVYNWEFVFLGANLDAVALGATLGIKGGMSMTFAANSDGASAALHSMGTKMSAYRMSSVAETRSANYTFFDQTDRDAQEQAGA